MTRPRFVLSLVLLLAGMAFAAGPQSVLDFTLPGIDGGEVKLESFRGKVLLLVNTASRCGFTPQYQGLQALWERYRDRGLVVLGFPANDFRGQEPGTNAEIAEFCSLNYGVTFPLLAKIAVTGEAIHPLYAFLTRSETHPEFAGPITWNFNKFLVDRGGKVVARFDTRDDPLSEKVVAAIEKALQL